MLQLGYGAVKLEHYPIWCADLQEMQISNLP